MPLPTIVDGSCLEGHRCLPGTTCYSTAATHANSPPCLKLLARIPTAARPPVRYPSTNNALHKQRWRPKRWKKKTPTTEEARKPRRTAALPACRLLPPAGEFFILCIQAVFFFFLHLVRETSNQPLRGNRGARQRARDEREHNYSIVLYCNVLCCIVSYLSRRRALCVETAEETAYMEPSTARAWGV